MIHSAYLDSIKSSEGFSPQSFWDYAQTTNGYGTKARFPGEVIDRVEADKRFRSEVASAEAMVETFAPGLDEGSKAALTSLTFNAGSAWMSSGLGDAIKRGDLDTAKNLFLQYNKAGGEAVAGLIARRLSEVTWFGQSSSSILAAASQGQADPQILARLPAQLRHDLQIAAATPPTGPVPTSDANEPSLLRPSGTAAGSARAPSPMSSTDILSLLALLPTHPLMPPKQSDDSDDREQAKNRAAKITDTV